MSDRRWTATIEVKRADGTILRGNATPSEGDTQRYQLDQAMRDARPYCTEPHDYVLVQLWKTTKAHGTVPDQRWYYEAGSRWTR